MTTLVNNNTPYLRILLPSEDYIAFVGGRLDIDEEDPFYEHVMAEAVRNPSIAILVNETTCQFCGEVFKGDKAAGKLADHEKAIHFDLWVKKTEIEQASVIQREVKARAGHPCDICRPTQEFGTADDLAEHVNLLHTAPPDLDDDGNTLGGGDEGRRPGEVDPPKAARASSKK